VDDLPGNPPTAPSDCQNCGICCFSSSEEYVWVTGYDWTRLGEDAERLAQFIAIRAFMNMRDGHCGALEIKRVDGRVRFCCTIYDRRPEICRYLERGSPECLGELETKTDTVSQHAAVRSCGTPDPAAAGNQ
jgi:Fe-S-cluster containining protein